jgi:uncharacterized protein YndB with AHSA1/START domain
MTEFVERELLIAAPAEDVWDAVTSDGWLSDEVDLDLRPGGEASFRDRAGVRTGWIEEAVAPERLTFWWAWDDQPATRVELTLAACGDDETRLRVVETRPLELLDLVGIPLPGAGGRTFGPALVAA